MNFDFTEEQKLLRDATRKFLQAQCPSAFVRRMMEHPTAHDAEFWNKQVGLGWPAMLIPEAYGGVGGTLTDIIVVAEELGRVVAPGPFYSTAVTGPSLLCLAGSEEQKQGTLARIAEGGCLITLALLEAGGSYGSESVRTFADRRLGKFILNGEKWFVPDAQVADILLVAARTTHGTAPGGGISLFLVEAASKGVRIEQMDAVDRTRRTCRVTFQDVSLEEGNLLGEADRSWPLIERALDLTWVPCCCEMVGLADRTLEIVVEYLKVRVQFDRPIGSFQSLQHRCADIMVHNELAKSLSYYACYAVEKNLPDAPVALAMAQAYCSETARSALSDGIQLLGGIGFTWEHDIHLYQRRAISLGLNMGPVEEHREKVASAFLD